MVRLLRSPANAAIVLPCITEPLVIAMDPMPPL
jgi:hypothetical protein